MESLKIIFIYVFSTFIVTVTQAVFLFFSGPLIFPLIKKVKKILLIHSALVAVTSNFSAVYVIFWLCKIMSIQPTIFMFLIPLVATVLNNRKRIAFKSKSLSHVKLLMSLRNETELYDQKFDVINEYVYLFGNVIGLILGVANFL